MTATRTHIAHGAFRLWHTFSSENLYTAQQGTTRNLMDYNGTNSELYKYQWDYIHNPQQGIVRWMVDDEESELTNSKTIVTKILKTIHDANVEGNNECKIEKYGVENVFLTNDYLLGYKKISVLITKQNANELTINCVRSSCTITKAAQTEAFGKKGSYTIFSFYNNKFDNALKILVADDYADELADWLLGKDPIAKALSVIETYIGKTYENDNLRTGSDDASLATMDCSELVARFLQKACGQKEVPNPFYTSKMVESMENGSLDNLLKHVDNSENSDFKDIREGDIFLWSRSSNDGHTGVVVSYNEEKDEVTIIEAIGGSGSCEEELSKPLNGYCVKCVRKSIYTRTGKALYKHPGWKGYFRAVTIK
ncbi:MAG: hypothetical protein IKP62_01295 [Salinivirgaceae bacterium]|nr:hypothetical protein [Salinivirgaceae bacterium]